MTRIDYDYNDGACFTDPHECPLCKSPYRHRRGWHLNKNGDVVARCAAYWKRQGREIDPNDPLKLLPPGLRERNSYERDLIG